MHVALHRTHLFALAAAATALCCAGPRRGPPGTADDAAGRAVLIRVDGMSKSRSGAT